MSQSIIFQAHYTRGEGLALVREGCCVVIPQPSPCSQATVDALWLTLGEYATLPGAEIGWSIAALDALEFRDIVKGILADAGVAGLVCTRQGDGVTLMRVGEVDDFETTATSVAWRGDSSKGLRLPCDAGAVWVDAFWFAGVAEVADVRYEATRAPEPEPDELEEDSAQEFAGKTVLPSEIDDAAEEPKTEPQSEPKTESAPAPAPAQETVRAAQPKAPAPVPAAAPQPAGVVAEESTFDYDSLFAATELKSVEGAARRAGAEEGGKAAATPTPSEPAAPTKEPTTSAFPAAEAASSEGADQPPAQPDPVTTAVPAESSAEPAAPSIEPSIEPSAAPAAVPPVEEPGGILDSFFDLVPAASAKPTALASTLEAKPSPEIRLEKRPAAAEPIADSLDSAGPVDLPRPDAPLVTGSACSGGHLNPPHRADCRVCGAPVLPVAESFARPALGFLTTPGHAPIPLHGSVVFGRKPSGERFASNDMPVLVTVNGPANDISRNHVLVSVDQWHVFVSDMNSTNGTLLHREGHPPRRLVPHEKIMVRSGDIIDLGDGVAIRCEDIP